MQQFTENLRQRVEQLGLTLAAAARRVDLSERRFANYANGDREPDLATLVKIASMLDTTPDRLLGVDEQAGVASDESAKLRQQLAADVRALDLKALRLTVGIVRTVIEHQLDGRPKKTS
jgi:transcriptional regulator with XRE-family HTH domain